MNKIIISLSLILTSCSSITKKSVCDYSSGQPNAKYVLVGSCLKIKGVIKEVRWVEQKESGRSIEQGHFVIDTAPEKTGEML